MLLEHHHDYSETQSSFLQQWQPFPQHLQLYNPSCRIKKGLRSPAIFSLQDSPHPSWNFHAATLDFGPSRSTYWWPHHVASKHISHCAFCSSCSKRALVNILFLVLILRSRPQVVSNSNICRYRNEKGVPKENANLVILIQYRQVNLMGKATAISKSGLHAAATSLKVNQRLILMAALAGHSCHSPSAKRKRCECLRLSRVDVNRTAIQLLVPLMKFWSTRDTEYII